MGPDCPGGGAVAGRGLQGRGWQGAGRSGLAFCSALPRCCCPPHAHPAVTPRSRDRTLQGGAQRPGHVGFGPGGECVGSAMGAGTLGGPQLCRSKMEGPPTPRLHGPSGEAEPGGMGSSEAAGAPVCPAHSGSFAPWGHSASGWSAAGGHGQGGLCFLVAGDGAGSDQSSSTCWRGPRADPLRDGSDGLWAGRRRVVGGS